MDKYEQLRNQVIWAISHYGVVSTDGIIETLRQAVLELDGDNIKNTSSNIDNTKCEHRHRAWIGKPLFMVCVNCWERLE